MTTITLNKGGTAEKQVGIHRIQVPDLWHLAQSTRLDPQERKAILDCWHLAHDLKTHIQGLDESPRHRYDACPECGCTDVEVSAWINANSLQVIDGEGPTSNAWCPQCEVDGLDGNMRSQDLVQVDEPQPFNQEGKQ